MTSFWLSQCSVFHVCGHTVIVVILMYNQNHNYQHSVIMVSYLNYSYEDSLVNVTVLSIPFLWSYCYCGHSHVQSRSQLPTFCCCGHFPENFILMTTVFNILLLFAPSGKLYSFSYISQHSENVLILMKTILSWPQYSTLFYCGNSHEHCTLKATVLNIKSLWSHLWNYNLRSRVINILLLCTFSWKIYSKVHSIQHSSIVVFQETVLSWQQFSTFHYCCHFPDNCTCIATIFNILWLLSLSR